MTTTSQLLTISFLVEENEATASEMPFPLQIDNRMREAVLAALAAVLRAVSGSL
jgi:hypothetical protein